jgi:predicted nucleic acid-binding protein
MSPFLLDTNVLSETARKKPDARLLAWVSKLPSMALAAITVYEIASGIHRLPTGEKRSFLEEWFAELLGSDCDIIPFDREAALSCAALEAEARHAHRTIEIRDLFILAIAKSRRLGVATRNVSHFRGLGVPIYDPFKDVHLI